jgi:Ca-activated chloride channel family protein
MHVNAHLDLDVVALEEADEITLLLELEAPEAPSTGQEPRPPAAVQIVLDRSGSMADARLAHAQQAITRLVDRLDPADHLGVVTFDDEVQVAVPATELRDPLRREAIKGAVGRVVPGGMTNLSGGLLRGIQEARRAGDGLAGGATLILLSDGRANQGELDPDALAGVAAAARREGVTTSTIGIGLGYDELLLEALARGGQGNHEFAEHGDGAAAALAGEVEGLLSKTVQAASLMVKPSAPVESVTIWNDLPAQPVAGGIMAEVGDLWAGERRKLVLSFSVPAVGALGLAQVAEIELRYVTLPGFAEQTITIPVTVNVVPGDEAAGRVADAQVRTELVYQQAQQDKRRAADALGAGDVRGAIGAYDEARRRLAAQMQASPSAELDEETEAIGRLMRRAIGGERAWSAKAARMDHHYKSRRRGRPGRSV